MVRISRRHVLSLVPAVGLAALVRPELASAQDATDTRLLDNFLTIFTGTADTNARPEVAGKLAAIDTAARGRITQLDGAGDGELLAGVPLGTSDPNLSTSFQGLAEIALATRTSGSALFGDAALRQRVIDGLVWLHDNYYGDQNTGYYGNWFTWEIGISAHVTRTLALLAAEAGPDLTATYVASMDAYLRNGKDGDVDLDSRFHTGANLADITTNRIVQGALLADDARITKAVADQRTVFATIDPYNLQHGVTDGYYADGSFIQHHSVAYTGSYGKALLTRVVQTIKMLDGTAHAGGADLVGVVRGWVVNGFAPLIFEGWMMEAVKGRAVSRTATGYADVAVVVEAIVDLADYATGADALALKGFAKYVQEQAREPLDPAKFTSPVSVTRFADIVADDSLPAEDLNPPARTVAFNAMDRVVHRRPGYAFTLSRSSTRISRYEYMSGENLMPWFAGDGAYHLYLSGQDQRHAFGVDYLTTVSPYRLAGVTAPVETRKTIPELYGGKLFYDNPDHPLEFTASSESQNKYVYFPRGRNDFSGGATLDTYGAAGMVQSDDVPWTDKQAGILPADFVAYQNCHSLRSWFLLDDEIVVLVAGVTDPAGRDVVTTVDSRIAAPGDRVAISGARRDGTPWHGTGTADLAWLQYVNGTERTAVGYAFLDRHEVTVAQAEVTNSLRVVRVSNPDTPVTKNVFSVTAAHTGADRLAYALVPNATRGQLRSYADGPISVLANDYPVQAIHHAGLSLTAATVFASDWASVGDLTIAGPASVIVIRRPDGTIAVSLADPTTRVPTISLVLPGDLRLVSGDGVRVSPVAGGTRIDADTHQAYGRSITAVLA
jgi:polysaccharide lyase family 8-like protein